MNVYFALKGSNLFIIISYHSSWMLCWVAAVSSKNKDNDQLICVFVFAYAKIRFSYDEDPMFITSPLMRRQF